MTLKEAGPLVVLRQAVEALHTEAATQIGSLHYRVAVVAKADVLRLIDAALAPKERGIPSLTIAEQAESIVTSLARAMYVAADDLGYHVPTVLEGEPLSPEARTFARRVAGGVQDGDAVKVLGRIASLGWVMDVLPDDLADDISEVLGR